MQVPFMTSLLPAFQKMVSLTAVHASSMTSRAMPIRRMSSGPSADIETGLTRHDAISGTHGWGLGTVEIAALVGPG